MAESNAIPEMFCIPPTDEDIKAGRYDWVNCPGAIKPPVTPVRSRLR